MGATNHTTYYELSQFIGTDKPAWLQDYNGDMLKIDAGINAAKVAADNAATAASGAQGDATDALEAITTINGNLETINTTLGAAVGNINTINALIGNGTPTTSDQTIIGAINGLEGSIAPREDGASLANSYAIGEQFARGGSVYKALTALTANTPFESLVLNTNYEVSDPVVEQISTVRNEISGNILLHTVLHEVSVTADGVKSCATLLSELATAALTYVQSLADNEHCIPIACNTPYGTFNILGAPYPNNAVTAFTWRFLRNQIKDNTDLESVRLDIATSAGNIKAMSAYIDHSDGTYHVTDITANVPSDGSAFAIYFDVYETLD